MKKKKSKLIKIVKETPETRKRRVTSGIKFRAAVFENKKRQALLDRKSKDRFDEDD